MLVCLPFAVLDKFFTNTAKRRVNTVTGSEQERALNRTMAEHSLRATKVTVAARLPEFRMPIRDIASLREGGVLATALPHNTPIRVRIGPQERFAGIAGRVGQQLAVRIQGPVQELETTSIVTTERAAHFAPSVVMDEQHTNGSGTIG
jgi:flagellar motor switch protein FliM